MKGQSFLRREYWHMLSVAILSQLVNAIKGLTDTLVAGRALGESGVTVTSLTTPIFLAICFVEALIITGGMTAAQRAVGRGDKAECNRIFSQTMIVVFIVGIAFSLTTFFMAGQLAELMGKGSQVVPQCEEFLRTLAPATGLLLFKDMIIVAACNDGKLSFVRICTTAEMVLNAIFDCLMVGPFGIGGIALGSAISGAIVCGIMVWALLTKKFSYSFVPIFSVKSFISTVTLGLPTAALAALNGVTTIALNRYILSAFGENAVFLYSFVVTFSLFTSMLVGSAQTAMQPFSSIYFGENNALGMRALGKVAWRYMVLLSVILAVGFAVLSPFLGRIFGAEVSSWAQVGHVVRIQCIFVLLYSACGFLGAFYSGSGHIVLSMTNVILRTSVLLIPSVVILCTVFGLEGLWYSRALAEGTALMITLCEAFVCSRRRVSPILLIDRDIEKNSLCIDMDGDMDSYMYARDRVAEFLQNAGETKAAIGRAMLYIEETGTLAQKLNIGASEVTVILNETPVLIFRDNSNVDYTDPDCMMDSMEYYAALCILNSASSKLHIRSIGYNRVIYSL